MKLALRTKILFLIFCLTGTWALWGLLVNNSSNTIEGSQLTIAVSDTADIKSIEYTGTEKQQVLITKITATKWRVNHQYDVRQELVNLLKAGLIKIEVKRPVAEESKNKVKDLLLSKGASVKVQTSANAYEFKIMANESDPNSSYYLGKDQIPYIVHVPGISGNIANVFTLKVGDWRDKTLFSSDPRTLQKLKVSYPDFKESNFEIKFENGQYTVLGVSPYDSTKLFTYLSLYQQLNVDKYVMENSESILKQLSAQQPEATIELQDIYQEKSKTVDIYTNVNNGKTIYLLIKPSGELAEVNPKNFYKLLVKKNFFSPRNP